MVGSGDGQTWRLSSTTLKPPEIRALMHATLTLPVSNMPRPRRPSIELPAHVNAVRVKGRPYYYYQPGRGTKKAAKAVRLPDDPRQPEFWTATAKPQATRSPSSTREVLSTPFDPQVGTL
jgi:hypothetical protein